MVDELAQLRRRVGQQDAAADIEHGLLGREQLADDLGRGLVVERGLGAASSCWPNALEELTSTSLEKMSIGTSTSTGPGRPLSASVKAFSMISGNRCGESTRQARLTNGR